jgi:hypothetical protein
LPVIDPAGTRGIPIAVMLCDAVRVQVETVFSVVARTHPVIAGTPCCGSGADLAGIRQLTGLRYIEAISRLEGRRRVGRGYGNGGSRSSEEDKADDGAEDSGVSEHVGDCFGFSQQLERPGG